ncbi:uncharacterized protein LOC111409010 isoform X2 [Olea europaea var. sylvestris]|uniref:uncharacterized protein LOC111409010 isoform X2 n=1 Tax=Olea europaea var. sylvestris TaxID=158386 RepID=UPI000C1D3027|nr:uncharacterized protein LOC111409010 isoform X2 [Olea europaea var. sylvestris]
MPILFSPSTSPLHNFPWRFSSHSLSPLSTADHRRLSSLSSLFDFHRQPTAPQTSLLSLSAFHRHAHSHRSPPRTQIIKWAEVLFADAFLAFEDADLTDDKDLPQAAQSNFRAQLTIKHRIQTPNREMTDRRTAHFLWLFFSFAC